MMAFVPSILASFAFCDLHFVYGYAAARRAAMGSSQEGATALQPPLRPAHVQGRKYRMCREIVEASAAGFRINIESILQPGRKVSLEAPRNCRLNAMLMVNQA